MSGTKIDCLGRSVIEWFGGDIRDFSGIDKNCVPMKNIPLDPVTAPLFSIAERDGNPSSLCEEDYLSFVLYTDTWKKCSKEDEVCQRRMSISDSRFSVLGMNSGQLLIQRLEQLPDDLLGIQRLRAKIDMRIAKLLESAWSMVNETQTTPEAGYLSGYLRFVSRNMEDICYQPIYENYAAKSPLGWDIGADYLEAWWQLRSFIEESSLDDAMNFFIQSATLEATKD